jgi:hypothetical protein
MGDATAIKKPEIRERMWQLEKLLKILEEQKRR